MKISTFVTYISASFLPMSALSFSPHRSVSKASRSTLGMVGGSDTPYGPTSGGSSQDDDIVNTNDPAGNSAAYQDDAGGALRGNRFSKYAPDANLDTHEFKDQLKENMKADLERRRREDPNRGNQPAKTYLDNL